MRSQTFTRMQFSIKTVVYESSWILLFIFKAKCRRRFVLLMYSYVRGARAVQCLLEGVLVLKYIWGARAVSIRGPWNSRFPPIMHARSWVATADSAGQLFQKGPQLTWPGQLDANCTLCFNLLIYSLLQYLSPRIGQGEKYTDLKASNIEGERIGSSWKGSEVIGSTRNMK